MNREPLNRFLSLAVLFLAVANFGLWRQIFAPFAGPVAPEAWFLAVGQGDSQLLLLPRSGVGEPVKVLIDAGSNRKAAEELDRVLAAGADKYIDLLVLTHPETDHYGGFGEILKRYNAGAFVYNGRDSTAAAFQDLKKVLTERGIPVVALGEGAEIKYLDNRFAVLSPDRRLLAHKKANESSLVMLYDSGRAKVLFTGDIGFPAEEAILAKGYDISADILKVGHHGSKFSSGAAFVGAVAPKISVIGVGKNSYGHPTRQVLEILERAGSKIYRTDLDGTVRLPLAE